MTMKLGLALLAAAATLGSAAIATPAAAQGYYHHDYHHGYHRDWHRDHWHHDRDWRWHHRYAYRHHPYYHHHYYR
jgi:hypothetical protein